MFLADHLLQSSSGFSQIVSLSFKQTLMLFEVILTVRVQTHQTGLDRFVFSSSTDVAGVFNVEGCKRHLNDMFCSLFVHSSAEHGATRGVYQ